MNLSLSKLFAFSLSFLFIISMFSCVEDEISGCTDPNADNYNVNAINDLGNCIYGADNLVGDYAGVSQCSGSLTNPGFNSSSLSFSISKALVGGENEVNVAFGFTAEPIVFKGVVSNNVLEINDEVTGVSYPDPVNSTMTITVDIEATATMTYFDDDQSIDCQNLYMKVKNINSGSLLQEGTCTVTGIKQ